MAATKRAQAPGINLNHLVADPNEIQFKEKYDLVIICATLHHFVELEKILQRLHDALEDSGLFVTYEPVMRSRMFLYPATHKYLSILFLLLPSKFRFNHQDYPGEKRVDSYYHEYDRSGWTLVSIRSGELPKMPRYFQTDLFGRGMTLLRRASDMIYGANYRLEGRTRSRLVDALCLTDRSFRKTHLLRPEGAFLSGDREIPFLRDLVILRARKGLTRRGLRRAYAHQPLWGAYSRNALKS